MSESISTLPKTKARVAIFARDLGCPGRYCESYVSRAADSSLLREGSGGVSASAWWSEWPVEKPGLRRLEGGDQDPFWGMRELASPLSGGTDGSMAGEMIRALWSIAIERMKTRDVVELSRIKG